MMRFLDMPRAVIPVLFTLILLGCAIGLTEAEERDTAGYDLNLEGRFEEAIVEFDEAIRLDPQFAIAYNNRGFAYSKLGQHQRAIQDFDEAILPYTQSL